MQHENGTFPGKGFLFKTLSTQSPLQALEVVIGNSEHPVFTTNNFVEFEEKNSVLDN